MYKKKKNKATRKLAPIIGLSTKLLSLWAEEKSLIRKVELDLHKHAVLNNKTSGVKVRKALKIMSNVIKEMTKLSTEIDKLSYFKLPKAGKKEKTKSIAEIADIYEEMMIEYEKEQKKEEKKAKEG